jgi:hypothetical protein
MKLTLGFFAVAAASGAALYFGVSSFTSAAQPPAVEAAVLNYHPATPSAREFAHDLAGTANQYAAEHADEARLERTHCVQAARGRYMCSFAVVHSDGSSECHLIQARWTPNATSTITITLAGRVGRCSSLRDAIDSMS